MQLSAEQCLFSLFNLTQTCSELEMRPVQIVCLFLMSHVHMYQCSLYSKCHGFRIFWHSYCMACCIRLFYLKILGPFYQPGCLVLHRWQNSDNLSSQSLTEFSKVKGIMQQTPFQKLAQRPSVTKSQRQKNSNKIDDFGVNSSS